MSKPSYFALLRDNANYRRLFAARTVSLLGDWFNLLALFAMLREVSENAPMVIGGLFIFKMLPVFLAGPMAGVFADRYSRKALMVWSDLLRLLVVCCFFLVPYFPAHAVILTLGLTFLQAIFSAFFEPARGALVPNLIPKSALPAANALDAISWSIMYALGSALGGVVTHFLGWRLVMALDALSFGVSAVLVGRVVYQTRVVRRQDGGGWRRLLGITDMYEGIRYVRANVGVAYVMLFKTGWALAGAISLVVILLGEQVYHLGNRPDLGVALLFVTRAAGTAFGPFLGRRYIPDTPLGMCKGILASFILSGTSYFLIGLSDHLALVILFLFISHIGGSLIWVLSSVLLQQLVPDQFRGRVIAAELGLATLMISISIYVFSQLAEWEIMAVGHLPIGLGLLVLLAGLIFIIAGGSKKIRYLAQTNGDVAKC